MILPAVCFGLIYTFFYIRSPGTGDRSSWRTHFLSAALVWGVFVTVSTELLSVFRRLTFTGVLSCWALASVLWAPVCIWLIWRKKWRPYLPKMPGVPAFQILLLCGVAFVVGAVGLTALIAPPNTNDSLIYHMSRVVHWIQNHSVAHYPTHVLSELHMSPWAGFAIMHFQILSGADRFANLVQWFAMIGSILGVSLIAQELGANERGQVLSAVTCATIPMGILQASSSKDHYALSLWLVCLVYYLMRFRRRPSWAYSLAVAASLGLAILTKALAYIYAFPFLVWFGLWGLKALRRRVWKPALVMVMVVVSINLGHWARNLDLFGSPLVGSEASGVRYANDVFDPGAFASSLIRNLGPHLSTPTRRINGITEKGIGLLHTVLGVDLNDPRTTWPGTEFQVAWVPSEDYAGNTIHFTLIVACCGLCLALGRLRRNRDIVYYLASVSGGFVLLCLLLKWTPWHSRHHLPLFVLFSAVVGVALSKISRHRLADSIGVILILSSLPWALHNPSRPLIGNSSIFTTSRADQYFRNSSELRDSYMGAAEFLRTQPCSDVGLLLDGHQREYPLWVLLRAGDDRRVRIEHIGVENISRSKSTVHPYSDFRPCSVISVPGGQRQEIVAQGAVYVVEWSSDRADVFLRR